MTEKITFSAFGRDSYYHREWFKKNGFKFNRSERKWIVNELPVERAEGFASYCRKYGLTFERSDRMITDFDYLEYLLPVYYILTTAEASSNLSRYSFGKSSIVPSFGDIQLISNEII